MDQPLQHYMRLGLVQGVAFPGSCENPDELVRSVEAIAADDAFAAVEVRNVPDDGLRRRVTEVLRASRLAAVYEAYPRLERSGLDLNSPDAAERKRAVEGAQRAIDEAIEIGAERVNLCSGPDPGPSAREAGSEALVDSLCELAEYAAEHGAPPLALVPFPRNGSGGALIGPAREAIWLVQLVRQVYPDFGLTLDTGYMVLQGEDAASTFAGAAPYLGQVHLANVVTGTGTPPSSFAPLRGDTPAGPPLAPGGAAPPPLSATSPARNSAAAADPASLRAQAPPFGVVGGAYDVPELTETLLTLFRVGFLGTGRRPFVCFRVAPQPGERPDWVIAGAKRTLAEAWARL